MSFPYQAKDIVLVRVACGNIYYAKIVTVNRWETVPPDGVQWAFSPRGVEQSRAIIDVLHNGE